MYAKARSHLALSLHRGPSEANSAYASLAVALTIAATRYFPTGSVSGQTRSRCPAGSLSLRLILLMSIPAVVRLHP